MQMRKAPWILFLAGWVILSACSSRGLPGAAIGGVANPAPAQAAGNNSAPVASILPSQTPELALATPQPAVILSPTPVTIASPEDTHPLATPACTNRAEFVKNLNIFDNAALAAGEPFAKIWRVKNSGTCTWTQEYSLVFYSGEQMSGQPSIPLPAAVQPGETVDLRLDLVAPLGQASYTGNWVLKDEQNNVFGVGEKGDQAISVSILVNPTPMPTSGCVHCDRLRNP